MNASKKLDMTKGSIMKLVILFALPICIGNMLQQLYNTVDTIVIGNYCDSSSLAAVGTSGQPVEIILCIFLGIGTGISILVSQCTGRGDMGTLKRTIATSCAFLYMSAIPLTFIGVLLGPYLLKFMQVPEDTIHYATAYLQIIFLGTLGNMGYNLNAGILRGLGDSHSTLLFLVLSCVVNIVLDLVFVAGFHMGVSGVAFATVIAMYCSWACSILYIKKKYPELEFTTLPRYLDKKILSEIIRVGLPLGLNHSIYSVGHILMQTLVNAQGSIFMAGCSVAGKVTGLSNVAISSFSSAATTFAGQNLGAENYVRLRRGGKTIPFYSGLITLTSGIIVCIFCRPILGIFSPDPAVIDMAVRYVRIVLPSSWAFAVLNGIISFINGIGEVKYPTIVNILMLWVVRIPSAYLIAQFIDGTYIMACFPISFTFGMLAMLAFFLTPKWKEIKRLAEAQENGTFETVTSATA